MPQGKGTYGSKVGRPPKKAKYEYGGEVDPFSSKNPEGIPADQLKEVMSLKNKMTEEGLPTTNAQDRSQTSPDTEKYKEGGKVKSKKVDVTDVVKDTEELKVYKDIYKKFDKDDDSNRVVSGKRLFGREIALKGLDIEKKKKEILKGKKK